MNETRRLAQFLAGWRIEDIPLSIQHEAKRATLNWLGCALGGCRDETVERTLRALTPFAGPGSVQVIGRPETLDPLNAACLNAIASNILDFDDTHMDTVIHPTVPVAAAAFALGAHLECGGSELLRALILGIEAECRIGNAVSPDHYERGWHITATCGVFGAAAAAGALLRLDARTMAHALGIAATQAAGLTAMLGSMSKSLNMGLAARNGLAAALLAARGFSSSEQSIEAPRGFANTLARGAQLDALTNRLGETWELSRNAFKPFACGIVLHAVIDACIQLREELRFVPQDIARVEVRAHPLALKLAGNEAPATGLEGKLSVHHAAAVALIRGTAGVDEFSDACVREPQVIELRRKITAVPDAGLGKMEAEVAIEFRDGRTASRRVPHAIGTLEKPMSDAALEAKFRSLAAGSLAPERTDRIIESIWRIEGLTGIAELLASTRCPPAAGMVK